MALPTGYEIKAVSGGIDGPEYEILLAPDGSQIADTYVGMSILLPGFMKRRKLEQMAHAHSRGEELELKGLARRPKVGALPEGYKIRHTAGGSEGPLYEILESPEGEEVTRVTHEGNGPFPLAGRRLERAARRHALVNQNKPELSSLETAAPTPAPEEQTSREHSL